MSVLVRATDVPVASRMEYWRQVVEELLGPLEVRTPPDGLDGRDRLLVGEAGAVRVAELTAGQAGGVSRTAAHVRRLDLDVCKLDVLAVLLALWGAQTIASRRGTITPRAKS